MWERLSPLTLCINCIFTLIFAVFLLMNNWPISCRSISTVNQSVNFIVVNLCLKPCSKLSLIATSIIRFGNGNLHIYNRVRSDYLWFHAACNIYNEFSSRFVWSLRNEIWLAQWLYIGRQARTGGMYYLPNTYRNICNKYLNMQYHIEWVVLYVFHLYTTKLKKLQ